MKIYLLFITILFSSFADAKFVKNIINEESVAFNQVKLPIVFHKNYDISLLGLENLHPFDTKKYGKIMDHLLKRFSFKIDNFYKPEKITNDDLELVHTKSYISSLNYSATIARIAEVPILKAIPSFLLQWYLLDAARYATAGTVLAVDLALKNGWAINLSGGYHHAKSEMGGGFCFFADIPLAIKKARQTKRQLKVLVIDLDAHQGNGHECILAGDPLSFIFDIYVGANYPRDMEARKHISFNYPVQQCINDNEYLKLLKDELPKAVEKVKPDLIIYNAGTDVYEKDPLGKMSISIEGIKKRDLFVFKEATVRKIPILMVLSGGYTKESASITAESITQILIDVLNIGPNK